MHVMSFRVRRNIFPIFEQTRQNRHEMTRAGVVQKAPDMFLRGAFVIFFDTRLPEGCLLDTPKGCRMDTHAKGAY